MPFDPSFIGASSSVKERISGHHTSARDLNKGEITSLRKSFEISEDINLAGILLKGDAKITVTTSFVEAAFLRKKPDFDTSKENLTETVFSEMPLLFEKGKFAIKPLDSIEANQEQVRYESVIGFENPGIPFISYSTLPSDRENVYSVLQNIAILSSLPKEILRRVKKEGNLLVISTDLRHKDKDFGPIDRGIFLQLTWNEKENTVDVNKVLPDEAVIKKAREEDKEDWTAIETSREHKVKLEAKKEALKRNKHTFFLLNDLSRH